MYSLQSTKKYRKSYAKIARSGKFPKEEIDFVIGVLVSGQKLDPKYKDHVLMGDWNGLRECHIKPDLLLVYQIIEDVDFGCFRYWVT